MKIHRPALKYYGGKWRTAPWVLSFFPEHINYLEPCGGAASVLLQKKPSKLETYNDIDGRVVNFFEVLRDSVEELIFLLNKTPWSRRELLNSKNISPCRLEDARRFFVYSWQAFSHATTSWRCQTNFTTRQRQPSRDMLELKHLEAIADRLITVQFENDDALKVIKKFDSDNTLIYFDPPYLQSTRKHVDRYSYETDDNFHYKAAEILNNASGFVIVSGYKSREYKDLYESRGWKRYDKNVVCNAGAKRVESIYLSPKTQEKLKLPEQLKLF